MGFAEDLSKFCEKTKSKAATVVRKTALEMQSGAVALSPVDTGQFRGNWMVGIGALNPMTVTALDKSGDLSIGRVIPALVGWSPGSTIYLTNSLPQARALEYGLYGKPPGSANGPKTVGGFSRQAPAGMVRLTVQNFREYVAKAISEVK